MKSCVVTGATGFIGRHVVPRLLDQGWQVIAVSRNAGPSFSNHDKLIHVSLDLHDPGSVGDFFKNHRPTNLIHLAWEATPGKFWHSLENFRWISASALMLDAFVRQGGKKAVLAGSCAEYKWENKPLHEDSSPLKATTYYSASKLAFKGLAGLIAKDIDLVWARIFFPYGPDEDESKLVSYIFREISAGRQPQFQNPGRAVDLIHVEDVAIVLEKLAASDAAGTFNICSGKAVLPGEIALECARALKRPRLEENLKVHLIKTLADVSVFGSREKIAKILGKPEPISLTTGFRTYQSRIGRNKRTVT
ncbi:MAG: NAD(P)-dependent oxidoreductase [Sneathiella sp.]|nr:NAD(P)-dependent oxidoreductase [Sneathiella sp.]